MLWSRRKPPASFMPAVSNARMEGDGLILRAMKSVSARKLGSRMSMM